MGSIFLTSKALRYVLPVPVAEINKALFLWLFRNAVNEARASCCIKLGWIFLCLITGITGLGTYIFSYSLIHDFVKGTEWSHCILNSSIISLIISSHILAWILIFHSWLVDNADWVRLELPTMISKLVSCLKIYPFGWKSISSSSNMRTSILSNINNSLNTLGWLKPKYVEVIILPLIPLSFKLINDCFSTAKPDLLIKAIEK